MIFFIPLVKTKKGDWCDTAPGAYDAEQTNRLSSYLWGAGCPPKAPSKDHDSNRTFEVEHRQGWQGAGMAGGHLGAMAQRCDGEKGPSAFPNK